MSALDRAIHRRFPWVLPLARALADARVGDTVDWKRPAGEMELTIVAIRTPS